MKKNLYYELQLAKLIDTEYYKTIKIFSGTIVNTHDTNQLDLNIDSIPVIIKFLKLELKTLKGKKNAQD